MKKWLVCLKYEDTNTVWAYTKEEAEKQARDDAPYSMYVGDGSHPGSTSCELVGVEAIEVPDE